MAEETIVYGGQVDGDDRSVEINDGDDGNVVDKSKMEALLVKIAALEQEKIELVHQNDVITERVKKLKDEIDVFEREKGELKKVIENYEAEKKVLESVAARAADLEIEVSRLQHDLVSALSDGQDVNKEVVELKGLVVELRKSDSEKGKVIEGLEKEKSLLLQRVENDGKEVSKLKVESEGRIRKLEKSVELLEVRETTLKSEKARVEEETRAILEEKEGQIRNFKLLFNESQSVIARNKLDLERADKEKEELVIVKNDLEGLLKKSERKVKEMELKLGQLHTELEASEKMISGLKEKTLDGINGKEVHVDRAIVLDDKKLLGLKLEWPIIAVSASAVAAATIFYLRYARRS